ncbi:MAG: lysylphosphatidylglycerol synthase domain-containing protein, partial [Myxococcota bacterium]|nr:lysylphosphatidylglycerol synthase domain-containing protein [Myxococcota bacterium]
MIPPAAEARTVNLPRLARALAIGMVLTVVAYALLVIVSDLDAVRAATRAVPLATIGLALLASTGNFLLRGLRWDLYLRRVGVDVPWLDRWLVFLAGFSMSLTPGKVGELLKPALLNARHGTPAAPVGSVVVAERIADLLAVASLLGLGALAEPRVAAVAGLVWLGVVCGLGILAWPRLAGIAVGVVRMLPFGARIAGVVEHLLESLRALS